ncbi:6-phosphogluconolactonase [Demequina zhanjiangensis]|uniref:6-phosphogluconolactonase n=1 Tax=Demequina zhanjiangensis TaxID=3051659 RepID=A0ABT8G210_9MICO|nr:6-phosphogluconolactonase [Demequina sp. SYSU T00b26]MDN4473173.1 6-phosphogluconolactonase [Demequina sp. SYSU T00b26]
MNRRVLVLPDRDAVARTAAARLLVTIQDTLSTQDEAHIIVTGGTVGIQSLAEVAASPLSADVDWTSVHIWWGDERFVPTGDPDRNEGQAQEAMLGSLPLPEENIHRMGSASDFSTAEDAAEAYRAEMEAAGDPSWDVLMLGLGPDGHVASLFPGHVSYTEGGPEAYAVHDSPKPPPTRVTLSRETIQRAKRVWVVASGAEKAQSVAACVHGDESLPGAVARGTDETLWMVDAAAATGI